MTVGNSPGRRPVGRPAQITRAQIVDVAVTISLEQLSMVSVATALGVKHSTLYNYVAGREELVTLVTDRLIETTSWPRSTNSDSWRQDATEFATCMWRLVRENPGLATELARRHTTPVAFDDLCPHYWQAIRALRSMIALGDFEPLDVIALADTVLEVAYTHGVAGWRTEDQDPAKLRGVDKHLAAALAESLSMDPEQMLRRKLALILRS